METSIYNQSGKKTGSIQLPEKVFGARLNKDLVHEVIVSMRSNARRPIAHTKDRSDVRGGGKKPWQQKGLGRARHGSRRSPIWRGGGITFGPTKEKNFNKKINKKAKVAALFMLLSRKLHDGHMLFVDHLHIENGKTKDAKIVLHNLSAVSGFDRLVTKKRNAALLYTTEKDALTRRSFNNFGNMLFKSIAEMNPLDLVNYKYVIIVNPEKSIALLESKLKKSATSHKPQATS